MQIRGIDWVKLSINKREIFSAHGSFKHFISDQNSKLEIGIVNVSQFWEGRFFASSVEHVRIEIRSPIYSWGPFRAMHADNHLPNF